MLDELNGIDWSSLEHAHGSADDVPRLLRSLIAEEVSVRLQASAELHEKIWHQGTVYSASAAAVPFLFELLVHLEGSGHACVSLICAIATGEGWIQYGLRVDGECRLRSRLEQQSRSLKHERNTERAAIDSIRKHVSAGLKHLLPYLSDRDGLAPLVADTLGQFPEHASWLAPAIESALAVETDEHVRNSLVECKIRLTAD